MRVRVVVSRKSYANGNISTFRSAAVAVVGKNIADDSTDFASIYDMIIILYIYIYTRVQL